MASSGPAPSDINTDASDDPFRYKGPKSTNDRIQSMEFNNLDEEDMFIYGGVGEAKPQRQAFDAQRSRSPVSYNTTNTRSRSPVSYNTASYGQTSKEEHSLDNYSLNFPRNDRRYSPPRRGGSPPSKRKNDYMNDGNALDPNSRPKKTFDENHRKETDSFFFGDNKKVPKLEFSSSSGNSRTAGDSKGKALPTKSALPRIAKKSQQDNSISYDNVTAEQYLELKKVLD